MRKLLLPLVAQLLLSSGELASESAEGVPTCLVQTRLLVEERRGRRLQHLLHQNDLLATSSKVTQEKRRSQQTQQQLGEHKLMNAVPHALVDIFRGRAQVMILECAAVAALAVTLLLYSCSATVPSTLGRQVVQANWVFSEFMKGVGFMVLLPASYPVADALGKGMFMSGLLLSSWPLGGFFGQMLARRALPEASQQRGNYTSNYKQVRSFIFRSQFCLAASLFGHIAAIWSPLRASHDGLWWTLIALRTCSGCANGYNVFASSSMALEVTPPCEVMRLQCMVTGAFNCGMSTALMLSSIAMMTFGDDDIWLQGSMPMIPPLFLNVGVALTFTLLVPLIPPKEVETAEVDAVIKPTAKTLQGLELSARRKLIDQALIFNCERAFSVAAIEVCSSLISEVEYGFSAIVVGWIYAGIAVATVTLNMAITGILSSHMQSCSAAMYWQAFGGLCAAVFIFNVWPWWSLYVADTFVFVLANAATGIANSFAVLAAVPDTPYSKEAFTNNQMFVLATSRLLAAPLARGLYEAVGRNGYAYFQVMLTLRGLIGIHKMWEILRNAKQAEPKEAQEAGK